MKDVVRGEDNIGIVPHDIIPRYVHSMFPDEDNANSFIHLSSLLEDESPETKKAILEAIRWYTPLQMELL
ncbi:MAG: hypothetical protein LBR25_05035 [Erysipelotrichaceae bacterium]|nr:hypothetical protein [Erysipelotrichaceae bacterium]